MKAQTARRLRQFHQYIGLFFTPAILFFALSGALQTLGLHENHGPGPQPATWIRWMASVHQNQRLLHTDPSTINSGDHRETPDHHHDAPGPVGSDKSPSPVPLKIFVVLLSIGLAASAILGTVIALTNRTSQRPAVAALLLGAILPVGLLFV